MSSTQQKTVELRSTAAEGGPYIIF